MEPSHAAVAQAVAVGQRRRGPGIEAAARARGLDFVPLLQEHYYLVCLKIALEQPPMLALRELLQQAAWQTGSRRWRATQPWRSGEVLSLTEQLPWWDLPPKKRKA